MVVTLWLAPKYCDKIREVQASLNTNDEQAVLTEVKKITGYKRTNLVTVRYWMLPLGDKIYTIGDRENFLRSIAHHGEIYKQGRMENYSGGAVWQTKEAAWKHIYDNGLMWGYTVWEIAETLWGVETEPSSKDYHFLLIDRPILREVE